MRVVQVAHPHLTDEVLSLRVGEVVALVDLLRVGLSLLVVNGLTVGSASTNDLMFLLPPHLTATGYW